MYRIPVVWAEVILWGQFLLCKFAFIADKDGKFVSITNRYHNKYYYYNTVYMKTLLDKNNNFAKPSYLYVAEKIFANVIKSPYPLCNL